MIQQRKRRTIIVILLFLTLVLVIFITSTQYSSANSSEEDTVVVPILMYHDIRMSELGKYAISPEEFESDLKYLKENNYTAITMTDLIDYVYNGSQLPKKPIILSFDDGFLGTYTYAYELLKQYDMKIVLSVTGIYIDEKEALSAYSYLSWEQISQMAHSGYVEVQNHTYNLHTSGSDRIGCMQADGESFSAYEKVLTADIQKLQTEIITATSTAPAAFTYPCGQFSENTDIVLKKLGFSASLSCEYGVNYITKDTSDLFGLKRIRRSYNDNLEQRLQNAYLETK
jgi:peptidoglycan/xylan/chitin deacetylase (PgdA/CDA1 family)